MVHPIPVHLDLRIRRKLPFRKHRQSLHPLPSAEPSHVMRIHTRTAATEPAVTGMIFMPMTIHQTQLMNGKISH